MTCLTTNELIALGTPAFLTVSPIYFKGTVPVPLAVGSSGWPTSSFWQTSLVVSFETPPAQALMGRLNRLPAHHVGYFPSRDMPFP